MLPVALPYRLPSAAPRLAPAPARPLRSGNVSAAYVAPAKTAQAPLRAPKDSVAFFVPVAPVATPAPPPSRPAPQGSHVWTLHVLQDHAFAVLDDLYRRAAKTPDHKAPLDAYFLAQKRVQVERVRGLFRTAFDYAARHSENPALRAALTSDDLAAWLVPSPTLEQAIALAAPPPAEVVLGAMHRLRNAMAQLQLLRQNWPKQPV